MYYNSDVVDISEIVRAEKAKQNPIRLLKADVSTTASMTRQGEPVFRSFIIELEKRGFFEGRNLTIDRFSALGDAGKYPQIATDVIVTAPDLVVSISDRMTKSFAQNTSNIPIAALVTDPVALNLTQSLAHPTKNVTGVIVSPSDEIWKKRVEYLREISPHATRIFVLAARTFWETPEIDRIRVAIEGSGCVMVGPPVESPHQDQQYRSAFTEAAKSASACIVSTSVENTKNKDIIVRSAADLRMPTFYPFREYVDIGGLIAHDVNLIDIYKKLGSQADDILSAKSVGEIPFYQPYKLRLVINMRAAENIDLTIPADLLARADEIVD
jgi:putative tryptophan/tyrosine transport system substrate-binding protein